MISTEFLITSLIVVVMPGTGVIYTISTGLFRGTRAGVFAATGCTLGIIPARAPVPVINMLVLGSMFMGMTWVVFIVYALLADKVRSLIVNSPKSIRYVQRSFAVMFAMLGARLVFSGR